MSRIGNLPISIPAGVEVKIDNGNVITVKGPKGTLIQKLPNDMTITAKDNTVIVKRPSELKKHKALHGLTRSLLNNMVVGVKDGFKKELEIIGVGYRAALKGKTLVLSLGYSHPIEMVLPEGINVEVPKNTSIVVSGIDKQAVGQFAAVVRSKRKPEPYLGKGVRYVGEHVRRKEGKTGA